MNAPTIFSIFFELTTMKFTYPQAPKPRVPIADDEIVPRLSGYVLELRFGSNEMIVRLDTFSEDYIEKRFDENRDTATAVDLAAPLWRRLLRYFSTGSRKVEFDLVDVGDRSDSRRVLFDLVDAGDRSGGGMTIDNVAGVDGIRPDWTASENEVSVTS